jgi:hypothetical protein
MKKTAFSNIQLELLKMFNFDVPDEQLLEIRKILAEYFARKASDEMDSLWDQRDWNDQTMEEWAKAHFRKEK